MKKKILTIFDDPGGGLVVTAAAEKIKEDPALELIVYSGKLSEKIAAISGLDFKSIDSMISSEIAEEIINNIKPDLLLTATGGGNVEQEFRNAVKKQGIPSVVILDFWKDYKRRWMYSDHEISTIKDKICVMDELTKIDMTEEGFPGNNIEVTGHPYLDKIFNTNKIKKAAEKVNFKRILFLSQPLDIIGINDYQVHPFKLLLEAVSEYCNFPGNEISITVKLHPSEDMSSEFLNVLNNDTCENVNIKTAERDDNLNDLIKNSDIIFGYNSIALFDARAMGKRVISLNLFPMKKSLKNAFAEAGIESVAATREKLSAALSNVAEVKSPDNIFNGGIENCMKVIYGELKPVEQKI